MSLADVYCLVCNKIDGQIEVEDNRDTFLIVHKNCGKSHEESIRKRIERENRNSENGKKFCQR